MFNAEGDASSGNLENKGLSEYCGGDSGSILIGSKREKKDTFQINDKLIL